MKIQTLVLASAVAIGSLFSVTAQANPHEPQAQHKHNQPQHVQHKQAKKPAPKPAPKKQVNKKAPAKPAPKKPQPKHEPRR